MPTYEYQCSKGHLFEAEQSIHDPALKRCRICRAKATRLISASSFILKGGGWYSDGYGSSKSGSTKSESSAGESKSESKSETKTETKSESKAETKKPSGSSASTGA
jgi:putative FmdB family regulatory protein